MPLVGRCLPLVSDAVASLADLETVGYPSSGSRRHVISALDQPVKVRWGASKPRASATASPGIQGNAGSAVPASHSGATGTPSGDSAAEHAGAEVKAGNKAAGAGEQIAVAPGAAPANEHGAKPVTHAAGASAAKSTAAAEHAEHGPAPRGAISSGAAAGHPSASATSPAAADSARGVHAAHGPQNAMSSNAVAAPGSHGDQHGAAGAKHLAGAAQPSATGHGARMGRGPANKMARLIELEKDGSYEFKHGGPIPKSLCLVKSAIQQLEDELEGLNMEVGAEKQTEHAGVQQESVSNLEAHQAADPRFPHRLTDQAEQAKAEGANAVVSQGQAVENQHDLLIRKKEILGDLEKLRASLPAGHVHGKKAQEPILRIRPSMASAEEELAPPLPPMASTNSLTPAQLILPATRNGNNWLAMFRPGAVPGVTYQTDSNPASPLQGLPQYFQRSSSLQGSCGHDQLSSLSATPWSPPSEGYAFMAQPKREGGTALPTLNLKAPQEDQELDVPDAEEQCVPGQLALFSSPGSLIIQKKPSCSRRGRGRLFSRAAQFL
eukprot:TRINITY_DN44740_c0_g2_i1.p1 TRINITY_DN44740_c0_g2~~TRINITY_DN44740_c0_g2_i1.p1  ORF type:complete len:551 (+),score=59.26 TRINITY_DN44740_c0_g2_i1:67-1719(+)